MGRIQTAASAWRQVPLLTHVGSGGTEPSMDRTLVAVVRDAGHRSDWTLMTILEHAMYSAVDASSNWTGMMRWGAFIWSSNTAAPHVMASPASVSAHAHPSSAMVSSPLASWCRSGMCATAATPYDTSTANGNASGCSTTCQLRASEKYCTDTPSVRANMVSVMPAMTVALAPNSAACDVTSATAAGSDRHSGRVSPRDACTMSTSTSSQLSTNWPRDRSPVTIIWNGGWMSGMHMTRLSPP